VAHQKRPLPRKAAGPWVNHVATISVTVASAEVDVAVEVTVVIAAKTVAPAINKPRVRAVSPIKQAKIAVNRAAKANTAVNVVVAVVAGADVTVAKAKVAAIAARVRKVSKAAGQSERP
jgi:hypothetical protein